MTPDPFLVRGLGLGTRLVASLPWAAEEVRHYHVRYALMNIPWTKNHRYNNRKRCAAKIKMGFRDAESVSPVRSNIACLCDLQTAFLWLLRAR